MSMKKTLSVLNQMEAEGVIRRYALGGAVGALFYLEPSDTADVDVFISFKGDDEALISLAPLYDWLGAHGFSDHRKEGILIGDWPVQFLPLTDALDEEALAEAIDTEVDGVPTRVMTAEHLVALALRTGRGKDYLRILAFLDSDVLNVAKLDTLLEKAGLMQKWQTFKTTYVDNNPL
jgi:predicted nucleotidyltransferase